MCESFSFSTFTFPFASTASCPKRCMHSCSATSSRSKRSTAHCWSWWSRALWDRHSNTWAPSSSCTPCTPTTTSRRWQCCRYVTVHTQSLRGWSCLHTVLSPLPWLITLQPPNNWLQYSLKTFYLFYGLKTLITKKNLQFTASRTIITLVLFMTHSHLWGFFASKRWLQKNDYSLKNNYYITDYTFTA